MSKKRKMSAILSSDTLATIDTVQLEQRIYDIRGKKVMLDRDLANLYGVPTKALNQAVQRNLERFPEDFAFRLEGSEITNLMSQSVTSSSTHGGIRKPPRAFTELGIAMLSSVLQSAQAISVNIAIMRAFVRLRQILVVDTNLAHRIDELEQKVTYHDGQLVFLFDVVHKVIAPEDAPAENKRQIGFVPETKT